MIRSRARRGDLRDARQPGADPRDGRRHRADPRLRRRCAEPALAADPGRHLRARRPHDQLDRGPGLRRGPARQGRRGGLRERPRGVRRHDPARRTDHASIPRPGRSTTAASPSIASSTRTSAGRSPRSSDWSTGGRLNPGDCPDVARSRSRSRQPPKTERDRRVPPHQPGPPLVPIPRARPRAPTATGPVAGSRSPSGSCWRSTGRSRSAACCGEPDGRRGASTCRRGSPTGSAGRSGSITTTRRWSSSSPRCRCSLGAWKPRRSTTWPTGGRSRPTRRASATSSRGSTRATTSRCSTAPGW